MDSKTVLGYYLSTITYFTSGIMYLTFCTAAVGIFISSSFYVDAFAEDFLTTISEMNFENKKSPNTKIHKNDVTSKLNEAILHHCETLEYLSILLRDLTSTIILPLFIYLSTVSWKTFTI